MSKLSVTKPLNCRTIVIATLGAIAGTLPAQALAGPCTGPLCGTNTPIPFGTKVFALNSAGFQNYEGVALLPGSLRPDPARCGAMPRNLRVQDGGFVGVDGANNVVCRDDDLLGATFVILVPKVPVIEGSVKTRTTPDASKVWPLTIRIVERSQIETWHKKGDELLPTYKLEWVGGGSPPVVPGKSLCTKMAPMEDHQIAVTPKRSDDPNVDERWLHGSDHLLLVQGESYEGDATVFDSGPDWFNFGCFRSALSKMRLLGFNPQTGGAAKQGERQATLKMLRAQYVDGHTYTKPGMPLRWKWVPSQVSYYGDPTVFGPMEAYWSASGAMCLSHLRTWRKNDWFDAPKLASPITPPSIEDTFVTSLSIAAPGSLTITQNNITPLSTFALSAERSSIARIGQVAVSAGRSLPICGGVPRNALWRTETVDHAH